MYIYAYQIKYIIKIMSIMYNDNNINIYIYMYDVCKYNSTF